MRTYVPSKLSKANRLKESNLALACAFLTKVMRGFAILHSILSRVNKHSRFQFFKLIAFDLSVKVFEVHNFLFKQTNLIFERRRRLLGTERGLLGSNQVCVHLGECGTKLVEVTKILGSRDHFPR